MLLEIQQSRLVDERTGLDQAPGVLLALVGLDLGFLSASRAFAVRGVTCVRRAKFWAW
ncbi:hypothetical protein [Mesorhizobium sp. M1D.F.Ca.ET.043.01.1.1]|uniref:hypothetical protein n=1 Tax=Mesorhizobium sp. M1D.F.Ca.ET.043.01.1.1 TaxID=2493669 RepID=UPI001FE08D87|nr:hypothetical protein [Mesorhizobium sp. M1D.F.Ca.ET.043.01.1.1]